MYIHLLTSFLENLVIRLQKKKKHQLHISERNITFLKQLHKQNIVTAGAKERTLTACKTAVPKQTLSKQACFLRGPLLKIET
jgi:hypothetical protein